MCAAPRTCHESSRQRRHHPSRQCDSLVLVLSVSVYDCEPSLHNGHEINTEPVPAGNSGLLDAGYRGALKNLLEQLSRRSRNPFEATPR